tara:strand:- start:424 stop:1131 length:708 start_codon:yes stop_codon:yes gene_type:complete
MISDKPKILHYGLQRTGTNFLEAILGDNFHIELLNSAQARGEHDVCHKHARLYGNNDFVSAGFKCHNIKDFEDFSARIKKHNPFPDFFVVTSKDPYSWLLSHRSHSTHNEPRYKNIKGHPIQEYSSYYKKLISLSEQGGNFIFVKYIDMISNVDNLVKLGELMNLEKRVENINNNKEKVYMSDAFSEDRRRFYMDKLYLSKLRHDSQDSIEEINQNLDKDVIEYLGYDIEEPKVI